MIWTRVPLICMTMYEYMTHRSFQIVFFGSKGTTFGETRKKTEFSRNQIWLGSFCCQKLQVPSTHDANLNPNWEDQLPGNIYPPPKPNKITSQPCPRQSLLHTPTTPPMLLTPKVYRSTFLHLHDEPGEQQLGFPQKEQAKQRRGFEDWNIFGSEIFHDHLYITFASANNIEGKVKSSIAIKCRIISKNHMYLKCVIIPIVSTIVFWLQKMFMENPTISTLVSARFCWSEWLFWSTPSSHPRPLTDGPFQHQCPKEDCPTTKRWSDSKLEGKQVPQKEVSNDNAKFGIKIILLSLELFDFWSQTTLKLHLENKVCPTLFSGIH